MIAKLGPDDDEPSSPPLLSGVIDPPLTTIVELVIGILAIVDPWLKPWVKESYWLLTELLATFCWTLILPATITDPCVIELSVIAAKFVVETSCKIPFKNPW